MSLRFWFAAILWVFSSHCLAMRCLDSISGNQKSALIQYSESQRFNSRSNNVGESWLRNHPTGLIPFWDIPLASAKASVEVIGKLESSPFETSGEMIRVYAHYLDSQSQKTLRSAFGEPQGFEQAFMQSSLRTLLVNPKNKAPFFLKLPGDWFDTEKNLSPEMVRSSVSASADFAPGLGLLPEPAGIIVHIERAQAVTMIYRKAHKAAQEDLYILHTLLSQDFAKTKKGLALFPDRAAQVSWAIDLLPEQVAKLLVLNHLDSGRLIETHAQNLDFLLHHSRKILAGFHRDLQGARYDPLLDLVMNGKIKTENLNGQSFLLYAWQGPQSKGQSVSTFLSPRLSQIEDAIVKLEQTSSDKESLPKKGSSTDWSLGDFRNHSAAVQTFKMKFIKTVWERVRQPIEDKLKQVRKSSVFQFEGLEANLEILVSGQDPQSPHSRFTASQFLGKMRDILVILDLALHFQSNEAIRSELVRAAQQGRTLLVGRPDIFEISPAHHNTLRTMNSNVYNYVGIYRGRRAALEVINGQIIDYVIEAEIRDNTKGQKL